jgi:hypothetical protein
VFLCNAPHRTEKSIKSKNRMIYHVPLLDERTIKLGEVPLVIKSVNSFCVSGSGPWWQSGESNRTEYRMQPSLTLQQYASEK